MVWLIGAIATYGIVMLLIGIAVLVYLDGSGSSEAEARENEARRTRGRASVMRGSMPGQELG